MVFAPCMDLYSQCFTSKNEGGQPFMTLDAFVLRDHKLRRIYNFFTKLTQNISFLPQKSPSGIPFATGPQQKTWWLILESFCRCRDIGMKNSQLNLYDRNLGSALCGQLLHFFDQLLSYWSWTISVKLLLSCLQIHKLFFDIVHNRISLIQPVHQSHVQHFLLVQRCIYLFFQLLGLLQLCQSLCESDGSHYTFYFVIELLQCSHFYPQPLYIKVLLHVCQDHEPLFKKVVYNLLLHYLPPLSPVWQWLHGAPLLLVELKARDSTIIM